MLTLHDRLDTLARLGRAMADPTRCRILLHLLDGPAYPGDLADALGLTRPNVSNHLGCLRGCGLVVAEPQGRQVRYEISDPHLTRSIEGLMSVVLAVRDGSPCADAACEVPGCCAETNEATDR